MPTSYGAICSDFYINSKLTLKMDLPTGRETVLELFERIRREAPDLRRFRRYQDELALESTHRDGGPEKWVALQRHSVRCGVVNPDSLEAGYRLHELVMTLAPYYLTINPLDVAAMEVVFGFDLEAGGNHHAIIHDALLAGSSLGSLVDSDEQSLMDVQPVIGAALTKSRELRAFYEVKARTGPRQIEQSPEREEPISVYLTVRRQGAAPDDIRELTDIFKGLCEHAESLSESRVIPHLLSPLRESIASQRF